MRMAYSGCTDLSWRHGEGMVLDATHSGGLALSIRFVLPNRIER
jgi:hypothetical protein